MNYLRQLDILPPEKLAFPLVVIGAGHRLYQGQRLQGVVVSAVDSMDVRKAIWKRVRLNFQVPLFLDARMGAEFARHYALRPTDLDAVGFYETNLYGSEEAEPLPCSGRSIVYCPTVIGGMIAALIARHVRGEHVPLEMLVDLRSFQLLWS